MKFFILLLPVFFVQAASALCVQQFNAYGPVYAPDVRARTQLFTEELMSQNPNCEVIQFQEVWNQSQTVQISDRMSSHYSLSKPNVRHKIGLMSMFQAQFLSEETFRFRVNYSASDPLDHIRQIAGITKAFHIVVSRAYTAEEIYFVNTHTHPSSQAVRIAQMLELIQWRAAHQDRKLILTGDLNVIPESLEYSMATHLMGLKDVFTQVKHSYPVDFCTYCEENPRHWIAGNRVIDYIFYSNKGGLNSFIEPRSIGRNLMGTLDFTYSDHYGLQAQLEFVTRLEEPTEPIESRLEYALKVTESSLKVLNLQSSPDFDPAVLVLQNIKQQIQDQNGPYFQLIISP